MADFDERQLGALLRQFSPNEELDSVTALNRGFSNRSFRIKTKRLDQTQGDYIVKRYAEHEHVTGRDRNTRAQIEFETLKFLYENKIPSPEPVYFELNDSTLHSAVLVTKALRGEQIMANPGNPRWAEKAPVV